MKILKVEFENINSLRKKHLIDFSSAPFAGNSLFAITGPTGSGKSSILDVISLALFNQVPRLGKITRKEIIEKGAILSKNQKDAFAKVTYECKSGIFASSWRISTNRNGNLREHEMEILDLTTEKLLDLKKSEVPTKNEELIGLNFDQFNKSVVLAQGEFAQFLSARKHERGELLEKITGTGIYRQLGKMAYEKFREVNAAILEQQQKIELIRPKILEEARQQEISAALLEKEKTCTTLEKEKDSLKEAIQLKENIQLKVKEISSLEGTQALSQKLMREFEEQHGLPLKEHDKVKHFSEELRNWRQLVQEIEGLEKELQQKAAEEEKNLDEIQKCLEATGAFTKMQITPENLTDRLGEFRLQVSQLQEARQQKGSAYKELKLEIKSTFREVDCKLSENPEEALTQLEKAQASTELRLSAIQEQLQLDLKNPEREKQRIKESLQLTREAQQEWGKLEQLKKDRKRTEAEAEKIRLEKQNLPQELADLEPQIKNHSLQLENLQLRKENQLLVASAEEQRSKLRDGQPCHVCGATEHPYAHQLPPKENSLDTRITTQRKLWEELNGRYISKKADLKNLERQLIQCTNIQTQLSEEYESKSANFKRRYAILTTDLQDIDWNAECLRLEEQLQKLDEYVQEQRLYQAVTAGIPLYQNLKQIINEGKRLKEQLEELYSGTDINGDCQKLQGNWIRFSHEQSNLRKQQQEIKNKLQEKHQQKQELEEQLQPALSEKGYETIHSACNVLLSERQYHELHGRREKILQELNRQTASLQLLNSQLKGMRNSELEEDKDSLQEKLDAQLSKLDLEKKACEEARRVLTNDSEYRKELGTLKTSIADQEKTNSRWRMLNDLIGDATGKKFNDFAQDLTLAQLLQLANVRLRNLSDRYQIDKPLAEEDDSLVAIDEHMGGQRRSVKTLSGGETFILSLSMALALSDLASRNVEIDSLFIDEGFGTLDPETLDQTLDTLERLQAESSKTIGIISHVESLKERIATQIRLKRNGQGYSQLEVVG